MLNFSSQIYNKILNLAVNSNSVAHCRDYPFFAFNRQKLSFPEIQKYLQEKFKDSSLLYNLYIHFPFCRNRCTFCKYYSEILSKPQIIDDYLDALKEELKLYRTDFSNVKLTSLFIGGGTPTILSEKQIGRFFDVLHNFFWVNKRTQITIEGTPETIKKNLVRRFSEAGVTLLSIGVQSFNDNILRKINRTHSVKDVFRASNLIRNNGIKYFGIDLIIGLPGETFTSYQKTIARALELSPDFIECFLLTLGGDTKIKNRSKITNLDRVIRLFKNELSKEGYCLSWKGNFAMFFKQGINHEALNQHLAGIGSGRVISCLGFGARASSHFFNMAYRNTYGVNKYIQQNKKNHLPPIFYGQRLNNRDLKRKYIISQIGYYRQIDKNIYYNIFNSSIEKDFKEEINHLKQKKIVMEANSRLLWHLDEHEMGHNAFFLHALKYWYDPKYIHRLIKEYNI